MPAKLSKILKPFFLPFATAFCVMTATLLIIWGTVARNYGVDCVKKEFGKMIVSLNDAGYDIAYDKIEFSPVSLFYILKIENFKLYKLSEDGRWELNIPELSLNADLLNYKKLSLNFSPEQQFVYKGKSYKINIGSAFASFRFDEEGFHHFIGEMENLSIENIAEISAVKLASQRMETLHFNEDAPFLENYIELAGISLQTSNDWNMSRTIDEIYLNISLSGKISQAETYQQSFKDWLEKGGSVNVEKLILNWKPLVLVSRGSFSFGADFTSPSLQLITTSKGLIETMNNFETAGVFDRKGVFVSRIVLSNKAGKLSQDDKTYTIITPVTLSAEALTVEGIPVWENKRI